MEWIPPKVEWIPPSAGPLSMSQKAHTFRLDQAVQHNTVFHFKMYRALSV
jgi:hypothetical protein